MSPNPYVFNGAFAWEWVLAFVLTQVVEMPIYAYAFRLNRDFAWPKAFAAGFVPSLLTHPIVWGVFVLHWPFFWDVYPEWVDTSFGYVSMVIAAETFAVVVEAVYLHAMKVPAGWLWSIGANLISVSIGYLLQELGIM